MTTKATATKKPKPAGKTTSKGAAASSPAKAAGADVVLRDQAGNAVDGTAEAPGPAPTAPSSTTLAEENARLRAELAEVSAQLAWWKTNAKAPRAKAY